jgi:hypothetical protein
MAESRVTVEQRRALTMLKSNRDGTTLALRSADGVDANLAAKLVNRGVADPHSPRD